MDLRTNPLATLPDDSSYTWVERNYGYEKRQFWRLINGFQISALNFNPVGGSGATGNNAMAENAVLWAIDIANDDSHGYDWDTRNGGIDYDCSSLVNTAFNQAGFNVDSTWTTWDMRAGYTAIGFTWLGSEIANDVTQLQRGDILLHEVYHTAIYIGNGQMVAAHINEFGDVRNGQPGDQTGEEICVSEYSIYTYPSMGVYGWQGVLRPPSDVVGTGSSRKSATNSVLYHFGEEIEGVPNKKAGGLVLGGKLAPIFYNTLEDSGALPIELDVTQMNMGDVITVNYAQGKVLKGGQEIAAFKLRPSLVDEVRAGGRIALIIGRALTARACAFLGQALPPVFAAKADAVSEQAAAPAASHGYTRAQKIVGRACGREGVRPGEYVEVKVTTVGSQDTTGPMTRDELKDLACLKFTAPMVMQSFCHTCAYPRPVDVANHHSLPKFMIERGGVALRPGDGVIHSWLNRMCLPDTVGTGGDSHTRMPLGISFPAGSGLVAFAAATGMMPLDMPESVLVRCTGTRRTGITLRDLVHAIPYFARKQGLLTLDKTNKVNVFSGRILEIEGLEDLSAEHAFELADASAERSAAACAIALSDESVCTYLKSNSALLKRMAAEGYESKEALLARAAAMDEFIAHPSSIAADPDCEYAAVLEINMDEITEPILCVPNDPDAAFLLSECQGTKLDEIFVGSCMTNIGHYRAVASILADLKQESPCRFWMAPPTRMDRDELVAEGLYATFAKAGARMEMPGCSLCMGNQAHVAENATVISTSTRNFPNRLGKGSQVYLGSAELCAVCARLGYIPTVEEYFKYTQCLTGHEAQLYQLLNFAAL